MDVLPADFVAEKYLELNPDVAAAGVDAADHYREYGYREGRRYRDLPAALQPRVSGVYDSDGLRSEHNHDFLEDDRFVAAYERGVRAAGADYGWQWRVHIGLWAAASAVRVRGDFVECGVNRGFLSSAIMQYLDWDAQGRTFYLLDTFAGVDPRYLSAAEHDGVLERNEADLGSGFYVTNVEEVRANFATWRNVAIVVGSIPETLTAIQADEIAFLHLDLNCSLPEVAAIDHLWHRVVPGGVVLLDDYAYHGFQTQKDAMDAWAADTGTPIASLPTGQGLIVKA